jgi:hypothetical protein
MTIDDLTKLVAANAKTGRWLSGTYTIAGFPAGVGIKAYGLWVQRVECCGIADGVPEQKTQRAMRAALTETLQGIQRSLGVAA